MKYAVFSTGKSPLVRINRIGFAKDPEDVRFEQGTRSFYIIHYVLSGKGYFNGHPVSCGEGFLIVPHMLEEYYPDKNDPWTYLWIESSDPAMHSFFEFFHADKEKNIFRFQNIRLVEELAELVRGSQNTAINSVKMLDLFLHLFSETVLLDRDKNKADSNEDVYFKYAKKFIESNFHAKITVKMLTDSLGISQPYLYKIFMKKTGESPKHYIDGYKLMQAKTMLTESELTVTQIAHSVGFEDVLDFSKFFSARENLSPTDFRRIKRQHQKPMN